MRAFAVGLGGSGACSSSMLLFLLLLASPRAMADPLPLTKTVSIGRPPAPVRIVIDMDAQAGVVRDGGSKLVFAGAGITQASIELLRLDRGSAVALVRARGLHGRYAALLGRRARSPKLIWSGRLDLHGDPGERQAARLQIEADGGFVQVVTATIHEGVRVCGQRASLLNPRALDPKTQRLRPISPWTPVSTTDPLVGVASSNPRAKPIVQALRYVAVSGRRGDPEGIVSTPPLELGDSDPSTYWALPQGDPLGEFATATWASGHWAIRGVGFVPAPLLRNENARVAPVRSGWLVADSVTYAFELPAAAAPGQRYWMALPHPLHTDCLSIVVGRGSVGRGRINVLAEVEAYTAADDEGGIGRLVADLGGAPGRANEAVHWLAPLGPPAIHAIDEAWPQLGPEARRRAVRVLESNREHEKARRLLLELVQKQPGALSASALDVLERHGSVCQAELSVLAMRPDATGDRAALALARRSAASALPALLTAIESDRGSQRPTLREALRTAVRRGHAQARNALAHWLDDNPPVRGLAVVAQALAPGDVTGLAHEAIERAFTRTTSFEERWRLIQAASALTSEPVLDDWLVRTASEDQHWMLRAASLRALASRGATQARALAGAALRDDYPRVRVAAVGLLAEQASLNPDLGTLAASDPWPLVRAAVLNELALHPQAAPVLRRGIGDRVASVREAAVRSLRQRRDREAWPSVRARLLDVNEWPTVVAEAIAFARELCVPEAVVPLAQVVRRGAVPRAWGRDVELAAAALHAIATLGGPESERILLSTDTNVAAPELHAARIQAHKHARPCEDLAP